MEVASGIEVRLKESPWYVVALGVAVVVWMVQRVLFRPRVVKSLEFYDNASLKSKRARARKFPPAYPNGWVRVCSTADLQNKKIHCISALGRELIAFRGKDNKVGVLDAYCPHLGAHLGKGGVVTETGMVECPFHKWQFDTDGKAVEIPYCRTEVPSRAKTKAYHVREHLGMVFIWFHAEEESQEPDWELEFHEDCLNDRFYFVTSRQAVFNQHVLEMHMNSADYFHFQTLHRPLPLPIFEHFLFGQHELKADYFSVKGKEHVSFFEEKMLKVMLFGKVSVAPAWLLRNITVKVTFEGPTIVHFSVKTIFGEMRMIKTLLPVAPFKLYVEARWWAEKSVPRALCYIMSILAYRALEQDREVWENKQFHNTPMLVSGDGPFPAFKRYYNQFYSENSKTLSKDELDW